MRSGSGSDGSGDEDDERDPDPPLAPGDAVGDCIVVRRLGAGATGSVYEARRAGGRERVAIKVLHRRCSMDRRALARFAAEARAAQRIGHPSIVGVEAMGEMPDGRRYHVMELVEGGTLGDLLARRGWLAADEALPILRGIAEALDAAHALGITHRDLKPENVLVARDAHGVAVPRLVDFGLARLAGDETRSGTLTETGAILGTPHYMAPEQTKGSRVDPRADVYAFGVLAYRVVSGRLPFTGDDPLEILLKHRREPPMLPSRARPGLTPAVDAPILAMLAKSPEKRPRSASSAFADLEQALRAPAPSTFARRGWRLGIAVVSVSTVGAMAVTIALGAEGMSGPDGADDGGRTKARTTLVDAGLRTSTPRDRARDPELAAVASDATRDSGAPAPVRATSPGGEASPALDRSTAPGSAGSSLREVAARSSRRRRGRPGLEDPERAFR